MREDDLLRIQHIGDVIDILQTTTHHLYDPDELLMVNLPSSLLFSYSFSFVGIRNPFVLLYQQIWYRKWHIAY